VFQNLWILEVLCDRKVFSCSKVKFQIKLGVDGLNAEGRLVRFPVGVKIWFIAKFPILTMTQPSLLVVGKRGAISSEICGKHLWE